MKISSLFWVMAVANLWAQPGTLIGGQVFEWDFLDRPWNYVSGRNTSPGEPRAGAFVDRFFRIDRPEADAASFFQREYRLVELDREHRCFQLMAVDTLEGPQGRQPLRLKKSFSFEEETLTVEYELELLTGPDWEGWFSSEVTLSYFSPATVTAELEGESSAGAGCLVVDGGRRTSHDWAWFPKAAATFMDGRLVPRWWMILHPGETWRARISLSMRKED